MIYKANALICLPKCDIMLLKGVILNRGKIIRSVSFMVK